MNHWGDVSTAEYTSLLAGNKNRRAEWASRAPPTAAHVPSVAQHMLPNGVDWRGTNADSPVKNQAACGSCWVCFYCIAAPMLSPCCMIKWQEGFIGLFHEGNLCPLDGPHSVRAVQAFGAVGALETAYYRVTGKQRLFSEQNLIDCSWDIFDVSNCTSTLPDVAAVLYSMNHLQSFSSTKTSLSLDAGRTLQQGLLCVTQPLSFSYLPTCWWYQSIDH